MSLHHHSYTTHSGVYLKFLLYIILSVFFQGLFTEASAFTPTEAQLAELRALPKSKQAELAKQYGIDLQGTAAPPPTNRWVEPAAPSVRKSVAPYNTAQEKTAQSSPKQNTLRPYGYDLFEGNEEAFKPNIDIPIPSNYVVGPGDTFNVQLYGKENATYTVSVSREGFVNFPEIGPISLAGLTFSQAQELINKTIAEQMIGVKSSVTMGTLRTIRVFVLGESMKPGSYVVTSLSTMTNALFVSGGITPIGSLRNIQLKRKGEIITTLDLYDLLLKGDTKHDVRLFSGDVIFIPPIGKTVGIDGEIRRPAVYELKDEHTVWEVVGLSGGLLPTAFPSVSKIQRIDSDGERTVLDLDLTSEKGKSAAIKPGDVISVYSVLDTMEKIVFLKGHIKRPGLNAWHPDIRFRDIIPSIDQLKPLPDLNAAIVAREIQPTRQMEILLISPGDAILHPDSPSNILLKPRDKIFIFNLEDDREKILKPIVDNLKTQASRHKLEKIVNVKGSIRFPGRYPLAENMTVQDLISLAGGFTQNAYDLKAEITRRQIDDHQKERVSYVDISLADAGKSYLKEKDSLNILRLPDWAPEETIELTGEVVFPGKYTIRRGMTLSQIVKRAGGLTELAYAKGALFTRKELRELETERLNEMVRRLESDIATSNVEQQEDEEKVKVQDAQLLLKNLSNIKPLGRMVIDLPFILNHPEKQDISILDEDSLHIPRFKQSVTVLGEVQYPTSHLYERQLSVKDYIKRSGGTNQKADNKRVYVVKANGEVFLPRYSGLFSTRNLEMEPGDTVVVPIDTDRIKPLTLWTNVSQIMYQVALGAAAVASF